MTFADRLPEPPSVAAQQPALGPVRFSALVAVIYFSLTGPRPALGDIAPVRLTFCRSDFTGISFQRVDVCPQ